MFQRETRKPRLRLLATTPPTPLRKRLRPLQGVLPAVTASQNRPCQCRQELKPWT